MNLFEVNNNCKSIKCTRDRFDMSNNRIQKNIIQKTENLNVLQYQQPDNIQYTDGHVTAVRVNNSFNQLVENDIFNENQLNWISSCCPGPKRYDGTDFNTAINGYKVWQKNPDQPLAILHKVQQELSDSLVVQRVLDLDMPKYVGQAFGNVIICAETGFYMLINGSYEKISSIACRCAYSDNFITLVGAEDGVYQLVQDRSGRAFAYQLIKRYDSASHIQSVYANRQNNIILICDSERNIFFSKYDTDERSQLDFEKTYVFSGKTEISMSMNGCAQLRHNSMRDGGNDMLLYGSNGICQSRHIKFVSSPTKYAADKNCVACVRIGEKLYIGTNQGLYENGTIVPGTSGLSITCMLRHAQFVYFGAGKTLVKYNTASGGILSCDVNGQIADVFVHQQDGKTACCVRLVNNRICAVDETNWMPEVSQIYGHGAMSYADGNLFFADNGCLSVISITTAYNENDSITAFSDYPYDGVSYAGKNVLDVFNFNSGKYIITDKAVFFGENAIYDFDNISECIASKFGAGGIDMLFVDNGAVSAINQMFEQPDGFPSMRGVTHIGETAGCVLAASGNTISCVQKADPQNIRKLQYGGDIRKIIGFGDGSGAYILNGGKISAAYEINVASAKDCDTVIACDASQFQLSTGNNAFIFAKSDGECLQVSGWFLSSNEDYAGIAAQQYQYAGISSIDIDGNVIHAYGEDGINAIYYEPDYENSVIRFEPASIVMPDGVRRMKNFSKYVIFTADSGISATNAETGITFPVAGAPTSGSCIRLERSFNNAYALFDDVKKTLMRLDFSGDACMCVKVIENVIDIKSNEFHVNAITLDNRYYRDIENLQTVSMFINDTGKQIESILPEINEYFAQTIAKSVDADADGISQIMFSNESILYFTFGNRSAILDKIDMLSGYSDVTTLRRSPNSENGILFSSKNAIYEMPDAIGVPHMVWSAESDIQDFIPRSSCIYVKYKGKWHITDGENSDLDVSGDEGFDINSIFYVDGSDVFFTTDGIKRGITYSRLTVRQSDMKVHEDFGIIPQTLCFTSGRRAFAIVSESGKFSVYAITVSDDSVYARRLAFSLDGEEISEFDDLAFADVYCKTFACRIGASYYFCIDMRTLFEYTDFRLPQSGPLNCAACDYGSSYAIGTYDGMYGSSGNTYSYIFDAISASGIENAEIVGISEINGGKYVLGGSDGLYIMSDGESEISDLIYKSNRMSTPISSMTGWDNDGKRIVAISTNKAVLTSDDGKTWGEFIYPCRSCSISGCDAQLIFAQNMSEYWLIDDCGIERTQPEYLLVNDIRRFTIEDALSVYQQLSSDFNEHYERIYEQHAADYHAPNTPVRFAAVSCISVSMDGLDDCIFGNMFTDAPDFTVANGDNDIVFEFVHGDQETGDVNVSLSNFLTGQADANVNYILRRYMSGISELYVYVPTTNTQYMSHVRGLPNCSFESLSVYRPNLSRFGAKIASETAADPQKCYSTFDIGIDDSLLSIDTVLDVQATANSLPLGVYIEDPDIAKSENYSSKMYHSVILPTVCMTDTIGIQPSDDNMYHFKFACFGSDAQAVCIRFIDTTNRGGSNRFTIVFDPNGGSGKMNCQNVIIGQTRKIRRNKFVYERTAKKSGKTFYGWSRTRRSDTQIDYCNEDEILLTSAEIRPGEQITLYAVWAPYKFSSDISSFGDTVLQIADTADELYINGADIISSDTGDSIAVIDYGE